MIPQHGVNGNFVSAGALQPGDLICYWSQWNTWELMLLLSTTNSKKQAYEQTIVLDLMFLIPTRLTLILKYYQYDTIMKLNA